MILFIQIWHFHKTYTAFFQVLKFSYRICICTKTQFLIYWNIDHIKVSVCTFDKVLNIFKLFLINNFLFYHPCHKLYQLHKSYCSNLHDWISKHGSLFYQHKDFFRFSNFFVHLWFSSKPQSFLRVIHIFFCPCTEFRYKL